MAIFHHEEASSSIFILGRCQRIAIESVFGVEMPTAGDDADNNKARIGRR